MIKRISGIIQSNHSDSSVKIHGERDVNEQKQVNNKIKDIVAAVPYDYLTASGNRAYQDGIDNIARVLEAWDDELYDGALCRT